MSRIFITGGAGFIGSHVADRLLALGHHVTVLDNLSTGNLDNLADARQRHSAQFTFIEEAVASAAAPRAVRLSAPDVLIHLASTEPTGNDAARVLHDAEVRVRSALRLLDSARNAGVKKFIISPRLPNSLATTDPQRHLQMIDQALEIYLRTYIEHPMEWTSLALAQVYGPRQRHDSHDAVVASIAHALSSQQTLFDYDSDTRAFDLVHIRDVVDAFIAALDKGACQRYEIKSGMGITQSELVTRLAGTKGVALPPTGDMPPTLKPKRPPGHVIDLTLAVADLDWVPRVRLEEGLADTMAWLKQTTPTP